MSDDEKDIDIDTDVDDDDDVQSSHLSYNNGRASECHSNATSKRAHHNALERKRRDHIKDSFTSLRDTVPALTGEKSSRAQILKKASDYIEFVKCKINVHKNDIEKLQEQNEILEAQLRQLEKTKYTGNFAAMSMNEQPEVEDDEARLSDPEHEVGGDDYREVSSSLPQNTNQLPENFPKRKRIKK